MRLLMMLLFVGLLLLSACARSSSSQADITLNAEGCTTSAFTLSADREPVISLVNQADLAMVFTLPTLNRWVSLAPGERADFELPRYIMGEFAFFCISDADHTALGGADPFLCSMEPAEIAPLARSTGNFTIAPHTRIREILDPTAPTS